MQNKFGVSYEVKSEFEINTFIDGAGEVCAHISSYEELKGLVFDSDEQITDEKQIKIEFRYPLGNPIVLTFNSLSGFTIGNFYKCILY